MEQLPKKEKNSRPSLSELVEQAIKLHASKETYFDPDGREDYYGSWTAAMEVTYQLMEEKQITPIDLLLHFIPQTTATPEDLPLFDSGPPQSFEELFEDLATEIVFAEMYIVDPTLKEEDIRRDEMMARKRSIDLDS